MFGLGLGLADCSVRPSAAPAPSGPVILISNGTFDSASPPPTFTQTGVGFFAIVAARLKFSGGNGNATAYWDVPGTIPNEAYYVGLDQAESTIAYPTVSIGGGTGVGLSDGVVGAHSATVVAGSSNTRFVIQATNGGLNSSRHFELDNVVVYRALRTLALGSSTVGEETAVGTDLTSVQNRASGSTLTLTNNAGGKFSLTGTTLTLAAALDYETATSHTIEITETLTGAYGSPKVSSITINVTNYAPTLTFDWTPSFTSTAAAVGSGVGAGGGILAGSTVSLADSAGGKFSISADGVGNFFINTAVANIPPGDYSVTVRETNSDATNSPYDVTRTITINP